jgi:hypothetical protein
MSYSRSRPFKDFEKSIDDIILVLKMSKLKKNANLDSRFKDYILGSSIFLAHAEIENYIQDIFNLYLMNLSDKRINDIHDELKNYLVYRFMKKNDIYISLVKKDEKRVLDYIHEERKNGSKHIFDKDLNISSLKGAHIYEDSKYPSSKNLPKIYSRLGCNDIFSKVSAIIRQDAKNILEQIGTYRSSLAHTATLVGISVDDIILNLKNLKKFVQGLDRVLYKHIVKNYKEAFWKSKIA